MYIIGHRSVTNNIFREPLSIMYYSFQAKYIKTCCANLNPSVFLRTDVSENMDAEQDLFASCTRYQYLLRNNENYPTGT